jgi:hypothetical protein
MAQWVEIPIFSPVYTNVDEAALRNGQATLENAFVTEAKGHSRFPGLKSWTTIPTGGRVYLFSWRDDLIAVTSQGKIYRIGKNKAVTDATGVPVTGGKRVIAARTEDDIVFAAGGPMVRYSEPTSALLSPDAPETTHVAYVDGYLIAIEPGSGRFRYCEPGDYDNWPALNTLTAESQHDPATAVVVTPFRELLICGPESIEQWERNAAGTVPFFRRWTAGEGIYAPYTMVTADNAAWAVTKLREMSRISGQLAQPASVPVQNSFEKIDDWTDAWAAVVNMRGNRFIVLQMPKASTPYGTKGLTPVYDYRQKRWSFLFGWDNARSAQGRWPGWSIETQWGRTFVGGEGVIYEMDDQTYAQDGGTMLMLGRTGHWDQRGNTRINDIRIRLKRGQAMSDISFQIRANKDNLGWGSWLSLPVGQSGDRYMYVRTGPMGCARTWQFEYRITQALAMEIVSVEANIDALGH